MNPSTKKINTTVLIIALLYLLLTAGVVWYYNTKINKIDHDIQKIKNTEDTLNVQLFLEDN